MDGLLDEWMDGGMGGGTKSHFKEYLQKLSTMCV